MKSILDRSFQYTSSVQTDLKKTFARVRREQRLRTDAQAQAGAKTTLKVSPIRNGRTAVKMRKHSAGQPGTAARLTEWD